MPISDSERAVVEDEKVRDYLLNLDHPDGGSKAVWFHSLGYVRDDWKQLADDLLEIARHCKDFDVETTPFGVKYKPGRVRCADHSSHVTINGRPVMSVRTADPTSLIIQSE